ncbi:MAG: type III-B CRISPR module RAMP protein Cmr4 [Polyangiaceae bacterium]|nr:type III-B CRISPR module RAMP protein Cmr4 [Polyangiaceae bacterium]
MKSRSYLLHALSPLHAGTGQAAGVVDLPIARMRSTGIPIVPGSSIKGVLRDARRTDDEDLPGVERERLLAVFGPSTDRAADHAGALVVGDARLLALPVRSFKGTFAWVSSPLLLDLARRDLLDPKGNAPRAPATPAVKRGVAAVPATDGDRGSLNVHVHGIEQKKAVFLEDLDFPAEGSAEVAAWADFLAPFVAPAGQALMFSRRLVVVDDEAMTFLWETATQIDTRVRIAPETRTVAQGALWTEESLPPESLLIGLLAAEKPRRGGCDLNEKDVLDRALPGETPLQFGGKATIGRGRCRMVPLGPEVKAS